MSHFKLISSTKASEVVPIDKYVSEKTGLKVIIANVEGPLVKGFFVLATQAHDDDGLPHTLEHLIFLGSERYPYKGILDLLANRCLAHGTNAWTDVDHTCYTIHTAGDSGMLTLLPIYLDHILRPTLTNQGYITEVHHIDGNGHDAGVVYCEMQGRENLASSRCDLKLLRAMYPNSAYSSETGGILKNLRTSTNNTKVRDFHKKFYRAENLTVILVGQIDPNDVFKALAIVEEDIIAKREKEPQEKWVKPWHTIPSTPNYGEYRIQWPADTEDCGQVFFGWRGPLLTEETALHDLTGCAMLLRYLCDSSAAPLQRRLVEREDALAGDVTYNLTENLAPMLKIELNNVPVDKLEVARTEARNCLQGLVSGEDPIDMERLKRIVRKQYRETMASLETDPHQTVAFRCIGDILYSQKEQDFVSRMNPQKILNDLISETGDYWLKLLKEYFADDVITIIGSPSIELQTKMAEEERKRIEERRIKLGKRGLSKKAKQLDEALKFNQRAPLPGTLASVPVPSCDELHYHRIDTWSSGRDCPYLDLAQLPFYARVHCLTTNFVYINLILDTSKVDDSTRKWLPILIDGLGECPVRRGGELIPYEEVVATTEQLTITFSVDIGLNRTRNFTVGQFGNFLHIETKCEPSDYEGVVNHLYEVIYAAEITKERLLIFTQRLLNDVAQVRRDGQKMVKDILRDTLYSTNSNVHWASVLRQQKFLKDILEQLNAGGDSAEAAIKEANQALKNITETIWLDLSADFERYSLSAEPWKKFARGNEMPASVPRLYLDASLMSAAGKGGGMVVGVGGLESCFVMQYSAGPLGYALQDTAPLIVLLNYFTQLEGPMWKLIRGCGLSYGFGIYPVQNEGCISFTLSRSSNPVAAYSRAKSIVEEYLADGKLDLDLFECAKSTSLFQVVENEKSPADIVHQSLLNFIKQVGDNYNREIVSTIAAVTPESAAEAAQRWLPAMFSGAAQLAVTCHPRKVAEVQASFRKLNMRLEAFESMEASPFNK